MDSYIVRVYSRDDEQKVLVGVVEVVETQEQRPFRDRQELLAIMSEVVKPGVKVVWEGKLQRSLAHCKWS